MIFPPTLLDSSSCWNTDHNQLRLQLHHQIGTNTHITTTPSPAGPSDGGGNTSSQDGLMATAGAGRGDGAGDGDDGGSRNSKPVSMSERARLARVPQPVSGLTCPRCDSTHTKFCYFNNYSLTQPRHFCRACRRYWTRGGALRNVPVGGGYRRHAKRNANTKAASATSRDAASVTSTTSSSTTCASASPGLQYSTTMFGNAPSPGFLFADSFDPASLGLIFVDSGAYAADGCAQQYLHQDHGNVMEQCAAAQMDSFAIMHAMDHQMSGPPTETMPTTMACDAGHVPLPPRATERRRGQWR